MKRTLICFDIDGTLLNGKTHCIEESTVQTLHTLKQQGYFLALATGRSIGGIKELEVESLIDWDGIVASNGQVVLDSQHSVLFKKVIDPTVVQQFLHEAKKRNIAILGQGDVWRVYTPLNEDLIALHTKYQFDIPPQESYEDQVIYSMMIYGTDFSMVELFPELMVTEGHGGYGDVNLKGYHKGSGVKYLAEVLEVEKIIVFGDGLNDLEMFQQADVSVSMSYAPDALKHIASVVVDQDENQISRGIERLKEEGIL